MIILVGLAAQLVFFGLFVLVAALVWRRLAAAPTAHALRLDEEESSTRSTWRGVMRAVFVASALVFVRSIFRVVEFAAGASRSTRPCRRARPTCTSATPRSCSSS